MLSFDTISSSLLSRLKAAGLSANASVKSDDSNEIPVIELFVNEDLLGGPDGRLTINLLPISNVSKGKIEVSENTAPLEEASNIIPISELSRYFDDLTDLIDYEYRKTNRPVLKEASVEALLA